MSDIKRSLSYRTAHNCSSTTIVNRSHLRRPLTKMCHPVGCRPDNWWPW